ncbi:MAG: hypothetical protein A3K04_12145 [Gallionellales bacterium RBG_16_56_9]|nr:MAG: hypothetical protein A3K04_12145 [Gallionellales bacterium RBG_16_56_9]
MAQDKPMAAPNMPNHSVIQSQPGEVALRSSPDAAKAPYDLQFLDIMSVHHKSAVHMAQLVGQRSAHEELKEAAKKMIEDQQGEIKQLQEWRQQWYPGKPDAVNMKMAGMMASMKGMSMDMMAAKSGAAFDSMFLDMMSKHHEGAVKMAQAALGKAEHPEIKDLTKKIIDSQKAEIAQMATWEKEWKLAGK